MSTTEQVAAAMEQLATEKELAASIVAFQAQCYRGHTPALNIATEAAHAALQSHLDAINSGVVVAKKSAGIR